MFWWGVAVGILSTVIVEAGLIISATLRSREAERRARAVNPWI